MSIHKCCSLLISLALLSMAFIHNASAQNAVINVTGSLVNPTCTVVNNAITQDFGEFYANKMFTQYLKSIFPTIKLTNCSADTNQVTATISGNTETAPITNGKGFKNTGTATGVYLLMYKQLSDGSTAIISNYNTWSNQVNASTHSVNFNFKSWLMLNYAEDISPGNIQFVINISFSYS